MHIQISEKDRHYLLSIRNRYGLDPYDYVVMLREQQSRCYLCKQAPGEGKRLHVDHDHQTKKVRRLLCNRCNTILGRSENWIKEIGAERVFNYLTMGA